MNQSLAPASMTASKHVSLLIELLAFGGESFEQHRGFPVFAMCGMIGLHGCQHFVQPNRIGVEHRPPAIARKTITVDINNIDITGSQCNAFLQDFRAFIDEGENAAFKNFLVGNLLSLDTGLTGSFDDQFFDNWIGNRIAIAGLVAIPSRARLLPEAAEFADLIGYFRIAQMRGPRGCLTLAYIPAHVEPSQVTDAKRAHGKTKVLYYLVHLLRQCPFFEQKTRLAEISVQHAVSDETVADASNHADLLDSFG